jgi:hypothetical protein
MFTRGCAMCAFVLFLVTFASARPPKRMHYEDAWLQEETDYARKMRPARGRLPSSIHSTRRGGWLASL